MSTFSVKTDVLTKASSDFYSLSERINSIASQTHSTLKQTRSSVLDAISNHAKDTILVGNINHSAEDMKAISKVLADISDIYSRTEICISDKTFARAEASVPKNSDNTENPRSIKFGEIPFTVGTEILGFKVTEITVDGKIILEKTKEIGRNLVDKLLDRPDLNIIFGPLVLLVKPFLVQPETVNQKIVIETAVSSHTDRFKSIADFTKEASGAFYKITFTEEGNNYKNEIVVTPLEGRAGIATTTIGNNGNWTDPISFIRGEAGVTGINVKMNTRQGTEDNNINVGLNIDIGDARVGIKNGTGDVTFVDAAGETHEGTGISQEVGASASAISGRASVQVVVSGVENTVAITGSAAGVGGSGGWAVTDNGVSAFVDAEVIEGVGIAVSSVWGD